MKKCNRNLNDSLITCGLMEMPVESISPEDYFDNGVIKDTIESAIDSLNDFSPRRRLDGYSWKHTRSETYQMRLDGYTPKYNRSDMYRMRLDGYTNVEIAKVHNVSAATISFMLIQDEMRFKKILKKRLDTVTGSVV